MSLRRFEASTTPAALNAVRAALGPDAIILSNRQVDGHVEIIAAGVIDDALLALASDLPNATGGPKTGSVHEPEPDPEAKAKVGVGVGVEAEAEAEAGAGAVAEAEVGAEATVEIEPEPDSAAPSDSRLSAAAGALIEPPSGRTPGSGVQASVTPDGQSIEREADVAAAAPSAALAGEGRASVRQEDPVVSDRAAIEPAVALPVRRVAALTRSTPPARRDAQALPRHRLPAPWHRQPEAFEHGMTSRTAHPVASVASPGAALPAARSAANAVAVRDPSLDASGIERVEARLRRLEVGLWGSSESARADLLARLLTLGLGPSLALQLSEHAAGESAEAIVRSARETLQASVPTVRDTTLEVPGVTLLAGPDASARSDAMMKFAMQQIASGGTASLALVCAHTERSGVFEALEAQGRELGVVTVRARDATELSGVIYSLRDRPLVLADTGTSLPGETLAVPEMALRRLLVLPATLQRVAARQAVISACRVRADGCVLMQLTGPALAGEVLDAVVGEQLPVAWWSDQDARQVPLQRATAARLIAVVEELAATHDRANDRAALATLLQPGRASDGNGFSAAVRLGGCASPVAADSSTSSNRA